MQVWPSAHEKPAKLEEATALAVVESLSGAGAQGVHIDSTKPGATGITSYEQDQYIYVLIWAFYAMRILEELRKDRKAATAHIRPRLESTNTMFSDKEWKEKEESFSFTRSSEFGGCVRLKLFVSQ